MMVEAGGVALRIVSSIWPAPHASEMDIAKLLAAERTV